MFYANRLHINPTKNCDKLPVDVSTNNFNENKSVLGKEEHAQLGFYYFLERQR